MKASRDCNNMNEKNTVISDAASVRSVSTISSLKSLLPKKKAYDFEKERSAREAQVTKHEARATYFAIR